MKAALFHHLEELREMDHSRSQWNELGFPLSICSFLPNAILNRDAAQVRPGDPEAIDPTAQAALNRRVADIVIDGDRIWIELFENDMQIPNRRTHHARAGMRVIHRGHVVPCI